MKLKGKKTIGLVFLLVAVIMVLGLVGGCTSGILAVGWSGGTVSGNFLYVGSNAGRLVSINLTDNSVLRADAIVGQSTGGLLSCACGGQSATVPIYGTPVVSDNAVYMAGYNGRIYSYRADNFAQRWIYPKTGFLQSFVGGIVAYNGKLYIGCSDGNVYALDADTGTLVNQYKTGDKIWGTPAIDPVTNTLFIGSYDKSLYALNLNDLTLKWSYKTDGSIICTPLVDNGTVYFGSFDRDLYAVSASDGALKWKFRGTNWFWAQPLIFNGVLYAGCMDNFVYVLNPDTGVAVHDAYNLNKAISSPPVVVDNLVVFVNRSGVVYKLDIATMVMSQVIDFKMSVDGPIMAHDGIVYLHPQQLAMLRVNPVSGAELPAIDL